VLILPTNTTLYSNQDSDEPEHGFHSSLELVLQEQTVAIYFSKRWQRITHKQFVCNWINALKERARCVETEPK
jgi:hypothetical protein